MTVGVSRYCSSKCQNVVWSVCQITELASAREQARGGRIRFEPETRPAGALHCTLLFCLIKSQFTARVPSQIATATAARVAGSRLADHVVDHPKPRVAPLTTATTTFLRGDRPGSTTLLQRPAVGQHQGAHRAPRTRSAEEHHLLRLLRAEVATAKAAVGAQERRSSQSLRPHSHQTMRRTVIRSSSQAQVQPVVVAVLPKALRIGLHDHTRSHGQIGPHGDHALGLGCFSGSSLHPDRRRLHGCGTVPNAQRATGPGHRATTA